MALSLRMGRQVALSGFRMWENIYHDGQSERLRPQRYNTEDIQADRYSYRNLNPKELFCSLQFYRDLQRRDPRYAFTRQQGKDVVERIPH